MSLIPSTKKAIALGLLAVAGTGVLAQANANRIINIQGSPRGDLRNGPIVFSGNPVQAKVSTLSITAREARLAAPQGQTIVGSQGRRNSRFAGDVRVQRGRLSAQGSELVYNEGTGEGVLRGNARASFVPEDRNRGEIVQIKGQSMSLDVDKNISTSKGSVVLRQGNQSAAAAQLVFDEDRELGVLTGSPRLRQDARGNQKELLITGGQVRALTGSKTVYVKDNVKLVQGSITTTGNALFYDDNKNVAYVVGNAVSRDSKSGSTVRAPSSGALEQRTDLARVRTLNSGYNIPTSQFKLRGE
ncbi:LptA/OstA family protein [Deinococcus sp. Marseille-Q6407]|uniref:LptA/OstA family protein n=1 Tax=Deinococcus sp. Marseille-Q6407 TaxID=2969223 RepID=UPI0021C0E08F|nr:LptA/OstA family protein [Deinococcus sp. Marseille-Q6407]